MCELSIITVNYNNKAGLEKTINSVVGQTYAGVEYIIIDGGSVDGSVDVIKEHGDKIKYWVSEKDTGIYNAMNKGIERASGKYCLFLNSGDTLYDKDVTKDVMGLKSMADIVYGNLIFEYPNGARRKGVMPSKLTFRHMIQDTLWHPVSFIKRELFTTIGKYDESFPIISDYDFFLKAVLVAGVSTQKVNIVITLFTQDGVSASAANKQKILEERIKVQLKYFSKSQVDEAMKSSTAAKYVKRIKRRLGI